MKKIILVALMTLAVIFAGSPVQAGWTLENNPISGIIKTGLKIAYHTVETPVKILTGQKSFDELGDTTRGVIEVTNIIPGILGLDIGPIEEVSNLNKSIEENFAANLIRDVGVTWGVTAGLVGINSCWTHTHQAATWAAGSVGATTIHEYISR